MIGIIFGILTLVGWGTTDFLAAINSRKIGNSKTLFWMTAAGLPIMLLFLVPTHAKLFSVSSFSLFLLLLTGFLQAAAGLYFYKAMTIGKVSLASPLGSSWSFWTVVFSIIFLKEKLIHFQPWGIALVILGTILVSTNIKKLIKDSNLILSDPGVKFALAASLFWGISFTLYSTPVKTYGWLVSSILLRVFLLIGIVLWTVINKSPLTFKPTKKEILLVGAMAFLDVLAYFSYSFGLEISSTAIVAPIAATFPLVTILLARIVFKEKLVINQLLGIVAILCGIVLLAIQ